MPNTIQELMERKSRLEKRKNIIEIIMLFVAAFLVVGTFLFGRGQP